MKLLHVKLDYTDLFQKPLPHLWIAYDLHAQSLLPWLILDGNNDDETYCRAPSLDAAIRFARAQAASGDATADEDSIRWQLAFRASFDQGSRDEFAQGNVPRLPDTNRNGFAGLLDDGDAEGNDACDLCLSPGGRFCHAAPRSKGRTSLRPPPRTSWVDAASSLRDG